MRPQRRRRSLIALALLVVAGGVGLLVVGTTSVMFACGGPRLPAPQAPPAVEEHDLAAAPPRPVPPVATPEALAQRP